MFFVVSFDLPLNILVVFLYANNIKMFQSLIMFCLSVVFASLKKRMQNKMYVSMSCSQTLMSADYTQPAHKSQSYVFYLCSSFVLSSVVKKKE